MSEQVQTEEQGGSVAMPLLVGAGAGYLTKRGYDSAANKLAAAALNPASVAKDAKQASAELIAGAAKVPHAAELKQQLKGALHFQNEETVKGITGIEIEKVAKVVDGKVTDAKTHNITIQNGNTKTVVQGIDKLTGDAAKIMEGKGDAYTLAAEDVTKLKGGWVQKTAKAMEKEVLTAVRSDKAYKGAGAGIKAALSHAGGGKAALLVAGTAAATVGLGVGVKNMFSGGSHASKVDAERSAATPDQGPKR